MLPSFHELFKTAEDSVYTATVVNETQSSQQDRNWYNGQFFPRQNEQEHTYPPQIHTHLPLTLEQFKKEFSATVDYTQAQRKEIIGNHGLPYSRPKPSVVYASVYGQRPLPTNFLYQDPLQHFYNDSRTAYLQHQNPTLRPQLVNSAAEPAKTVYVRPRTTAMITSLYGHGSILGNSIG